MADPGPQHSSNPTIPASNSPTPTNFSPFGTIIQNPSSSSESNNTGQWKPAHQSANQGTATKWLDITHLENWYNMAKSGKSAKVSVNMFVCRPRKLREGKFFDVKILERHPFTSQTFVPLGVGREERDKVRYLVVVAPTLPAKKGGRDVKEKPYPTQEIKQQKRKSLKERLLGARPNPFTNDYMSSTTPSVSSEMQAWRRPKGVGGPDLGNLKAFVLRGDQAVTYGPGTWHAPMVVLGEKEIEFVVMQYANGVGLEDCQEIEIVSENGKGGLSVDVDPGSAEASAPGIMRAKL